MPTQLSEYKGFVLVASFYQGAKGLLPTVTVDKHSGDRIGTLPLTPPSTGVATEKEALELALRYGRSAIDGELPGVDVSDL
jgi:hypothetical protein